MLRNIINKSLRLIKSRENAFVKDEGGQVLVLFAVVGMLLVFCVGTITDYGQTITKAINTQTAADAAALAAGSWVARGGNVQQIVNGIHYDINLTLAQIITMSLNICLIIYVILMAIYIILQVNPFTAAAAPPFKASADTVRSIETSIINTCSTIHDTTQKVINPLQKILVEATPLIAMLHANYAAYNNGATPLPELLLDYLPIDESTKDTINNISSYIPSHPLTTWTLGYDMKMWDMLKVTEVFESPDTLKYLFYNASKPEWAHPYRLGTLMPFTASIPFWLSSAKKLNWTDSFILQKNKKSAMMKRGMYSGAFGFSLDIDIVPDWLSDMFTKIEEAIEEVLDSIIEAILAPVKKLLGLPWDWLCLDACSKEEEEEEKNIPELGKQDIAYFTFIVGIKSEWGSFLKLFGGTLGKDPEQDKNIPVTWAFATVKITGNPIHPGGLYKKSNGDIGNIKTTIVPFWISSEPFFPQARLVSGYVADWQAMLRPVVFKLKPKKSTIDFNMKGKNKLQKANLVYKLFKKYILKKKKPPRELNGEMLLINH